VSGGAPTSTQPLPSERSAQSATHDPYALGRTGHHEHGATGRGEGGPSSKRIVVAYGFWIFLLSDIVMFSAFFAAYAVLRDSAAGGPTGGQLFEQWRVQWETAALLASSFASGMSSVAAARRDMLRTQLWMLVTGLLGAAFLVLEVTEFADLIAKGAGPQRSAFLSAFFALVGCHGLHVGAGLLWLGTMMAQFATRGFNDQILRRFMCFNLFWHALDIIWVGLLTIVYLMAVPT
jgi:cytochrome o ubiquinol oxidase subunit 3